MQLLPIFCVHFVVRYAAHQLNLWPRVSLPETSTKLIWTGEVGEASVFRVWGSRAFVRDTSADMLSTRAIPCVFLGFPPNTLGWQFCHPTSRRVFPSQDVTLDKSVPFYRLFPYHSTPPRPPQLFVAPGAASGVAASGGAEPGGAEPRGAESEGAGSGGAEPGGAEPGGAEPVYAEPAGVGPGGAELEGVARGGTESEGAQSGGAEPRGVGAPCLGGAGVTTRAGGTGGTVAAGPGGARTRVGDHAQLGGAGVGGTGAGGTGAGGARAGAGVTGAVNSRAGGAGAGGALSGGTGAGGTLRPRSYFVPPLQQVLGLPSSTSLTHPLLCPPPDQSQPPLLPASPLPAPSPYTEQTRGLTEHREPSSRPVSPVCTARRIPRPRPPPVPGTYAMILRPSCVPLRVPLPPPPASDLARAASPTVSRLLAYVVIDPAYNSTAASALVPQLLDFAAAYRLDYTSALVAESESASPPLS
ncbi:unnamed protein product [Closterium sp. NIES-53]